MVASRLRPARGAAGRALGRAARAAPLVLWLAACAAPPQVGAVRFRNQPPVWRVDDRAEVPRKPAERRYARTLYHVDGYLVDGVARVLDFPGARRAADVNALGEVPDSTWFTNRIGVREVGIDELRRGPNLDEGPEPHKPWTITGTKVGGMSVGFLMKDARGVKYLLKFDHRHYPEFETAADLVAQKILWACGYNVPEDTIVHFAREDLVLAADAVKKDTMGNRSPMTVADLERGLGRVFRSPDGSYRGLASKYLPGIPIGGYPRGGVRRGDPNDTIPHQLRRSLRGQIAIFAWLQHTDLQEDNTLDVWQADAADPRRHYVVHYLIDFGKALGVMAYFNRSPTVGFAHFLDLPQALRALVGLGTWRRRWERQVRPEVPGVGLFESDAYHPGEWKANSPYWPFVDADRFDAFWGAKILARFTPAQLRAAAETGRFSDPRAVDVMTQVLVERQRKTARYWFGRVNPLDRFAVVGGPPGHRLCFDDLLLVHRLGGDPATTRYRARGFDYRGRPTGYQAEAAPDAAGRACVDGVVAGADHEGYVIVSLVTHRRRRALPPTEVHLATDPASGRLRVIGVHRR